MFVENQLKTDVAVGGGTGGIRNPAILAAKSLSLQFLVQPLDQVFVLERVLKVEISMLK